MEIFDGAVGAWGATGALNEQHALHTTTLLPDGKVLVASGYGAGGMTSAAELYNPSTGFWSYTGSLGTARRFHTATLLANGKVLVAGGEAAGPVYLNSAELYDPGTGSWSPTGAWRQPADRILQRYCRMAGCWWQPAIMEAT